MKSHTSTFGGNPLASLDVIKKEGFAERAWSPGTYFMDELKEKAGPYVQALMEKGIMVLLAVANVIRLLPPLPSARRKSIMQWRSCGECFPDRKAVGNEEL